MKASIAFSLAALAASALGCGRTELEPGVAPPPATSAAPPEGSLVGGGAATAPPPDNHAPECQWRLASPANYQVEGYPTDVVIGDFDGDAAADVLTVNSTSGQIALLRNLNHGGLTLNPDGRVGTEPMGFAAADFTGDGSLDLAVGYPTLGGTKSSVGIFANRGDGKFISKLSYLNATSATSMVAGDFNGDLRPDLAIANGASSVFLLLNDGDGSFSIGPEFSTGAFASYVTAADFDHDGALDLGVAGTFSVAVLFNRGDAKFDSPVVYDHSSACAYVGPLVAGDLTGDGYPELARSCYQGGPSVAVRKNHGDGRLSDELTYPSGQWPFRIVMTDLTGDGRNDLAVANSWAYANTVSVLQNSGEGTFETQLSYDADGPVFIAAGDLNGDGHPDLATAGANNPAPTGTVSVLLSVCQ